MQIRRAQEKDIPRIGALLEQVNLVHHLGRPDLFRMGKKYTDEELGEILRDESRPILAWTDVKEKPAPVTKTAIQITTNKSSIKVKPLCFNAASLG